MVAAPAGAAAFAPSDVVGLILWVDYSDATSLFTDTSRTVGVSADGNAIAGVSDKSGVGNHLTQATAAAKPTYKVAIQNGKSVGRHDGGDHIVSLAAITQAQPYTIFATAKVTGVASTQGIVGASAFVPALEVRAGPTWTMYAGTLLSAGVPETTNWHQLSAVYNGASSILRLDGAQIAAGAAGTTAWSNAISIGDESNGANAWNGDIGEVLIYNSTISGANLTSIESYLKTKWGSA